MRNYVAMCKHQYRTNEFCPSCDREAEKGEIAKASAAQEGGDHYKVMGVQPWDVYDTWPEEQRIGAYRANCLKYCMRLDAKDTRALNAKKLAHYARKLVEVVEELATKEK